MTTRTRAPRRERMFTTTEVALTLVAGNAGGASQQATNQMTSDFETRSGRSARGVTIGRIWVHGMWFTLAVVSTPTLMGLSMGMGIFTGGIDVGDFPDLATHTGDWMLHRTWRLTDRASATTFPIPLEPQQGGGNSSQIAIDNRSQRKLGRTSEDLFLVIAKDIATEENIQLHVDVTVMWLLP